MKVPKLFVLEKCLEKKTEQLAKGETKRSNQEIDVKMYYCKFVNLQRGKQFTVENVQDYFKELTYENALRIVKYEKEYRDRFLEGLADIP